MQCQESQAVPIFLFGSDYWKLLFSFEVLVEAPPFPAEDLNTVACG